MNRPALIAALACAIVGMSLLVLYKKRFEAQVSGGARVSVLMATRDVPMGTRLTEEHLGVRELPEAYLEDRHVRASDVQSVIGVRVSTPIKTNESVLWTDLASSSAQARKLASLIRVGMRAVSVSIGDSAFGGLLQPGDRVDALLTVENPITGERHTTPLAQNLLLLAVGEDTGGEGATTEGKRQPRTTSVTLAVTLAEGQRLTLAGEEGKVNLLLRNPEDVRVVDDAPEARAGDMMRGRFVKPATPPPGVALPAAEARRLIEEARRSGEGPEAVSAAAALAASGAKPPADSALGDDPPQKKRGLIEMQRTKRNAARARARRQAAAQAEDR